MTARAFITGISGLAMTPEERGFVRDAQPWGLILFKRNVEAPDQLRGLTSAFRDAVGWDAPVLVDQEGGRVQRLGPPHWPIYPSAAVYGRLYERDRDSGLRAAHLAARLIAHDLKSVGIDVDCAPVADTPVDGANPVIGDRAYGRTPAQIAALAQATADGLLAGGVLPVLKHLPGHGRATADSHLALPVVDADRKALEDTDFAAFRPLCGLPLGMTAHVVFSALDPVAPASTSAIMVRDVIRGLIGFSGMLMSDDLSMQALSGSLGTRTAAVLAAGCDIALYCKGHLDEMTDVAAAAPVLAGDPARRAQAALARRAQPETFEISAARADLAKLTGQPAGTLVT